MNLPEVGLVLLALLAGGAAGIWWRRQRLEALVQERTARLFPEVAQLRQTEERLEEQERSLRMANKRLEEMAALKDEFVAKASHELRTPLTSIKEGLNLLLDRALGAITPEQEDFLKTMDNDMNRLTELINNMLDISKIEAGRMRLQRQEVNVAAFLDSVMRSFQQMFGQRTVRVECDPVPAIFGDRNRLIQILSNLLSNAIRFTADDGTIVLTIRWDGKRHVAIAVKDNGPGIAPDDLPKLFQKFSQVGAPSSGWPRGTGLGLVVCKELAELHKGWIHVASSLGEGTTFTVTLPVYTETFAVEEYVEELQEKAAEEDGHSVAAVVIGPERTRVVEDVRRHVHRGDIVMALASHWVVVLAATTPEGPRVMIERLRSALNGFPQTRFGAAVQNSEGLPDAHLLVAQAMRNAEQESMIASAPAAHSPSEPQR